MYNIHSKLEYHRESNVLANRKFDSEEEDIMSSAGSVPSPNSNSVEANGTASEIPEWKRLLIMKKRTVVNRNSESTLTSASSDRPRHCFPVSIMSTNDCVGKHTTLSGTSNTQLDRIRKATHSEESEKESTPIKSSSTAESPSVIRTIGSITVELRSVHPRSPAENINVEGGLSDRYVMSPSDLVSPEPLEYEESYEDLQYGPGIVDRLRARFLNLEQKKNKRKPVVRKFSSLENLSGGGMIRATGLYSREERHFATRSATTGNLRYLNRGFTGSITFKKAQSMETLVVGGGGCNANLSVSNRYNPGRLFGRPTTALISSYENYQLSKPRHDSAAKVSKRLDYSRQVSASNIKEDELPKPDTVKHFKKIFESPSTAEDKICRPVVTDENSQKPVESRLAASPISSNLRHLSSSDPVSPREKCLIPEQLSEDISPHANYSAKMVTKESSPPNLNGVPEETGDDESSEIKVNEINVLLSEEEEESVNNSAVIIADVAPLSKDATITTEGVTDVVSIPSPPCVELPKRNDLNLDYRSHHEVKVTDCGLPASVDNSPCSEDENSSQGSQIAVEPERAESHAGLSVELLQESPTPSDTTEDSPIDLEDMVVASENDDPMFRTAYPGVSNESIVTKPSELKKPKWQKPPESTTSVVFDFRGKDIKPNISLNPAPFGCKPAKVKKRAGSPPRSDGKVNGVVVSPDSPESDEEDWDEMDVGADLPAVCGIVFKGENTKIGKGAFLETRNKKLTIQFNDDATATFEYPCETPSPLPEDYPKCNGESDSTSSLVKSSAPAIAPLSSAGLSCYMPHVLSESEGFELGVSRSSAHKQMPLTTKQDSPDTVIDEIIPASPEDTTGWSATDTTDILF